MGADSEVLLSLNSITYRPLSVVDTCLGELIMKLDLDPTSQTRDLTSTFTFHVARCDKIHNSLYTGHHILSTNLLYSGCTGMCDLNGRKNVNHQTIVLGIIKVHVDVYVAIKSNFCWKSDQKSHQTTNFPQYWLDHWAFQVKIVRVKPVQIKIGKFSGRHKPGRELIVK